VAGHVAHPDSASLTSTFNNGAPSRRLIWNRLQLVANLPSKRFRSCPIGFPVCCVLPRRFPRAFHRSHDQGVCLLDCAARLVHESNSYRIPLPAKIVRFAPGKEWTRFLCHRGSRHGCSARSCAAARVACEPSFNPHIDTLYGSPLIFDPRCRSSLACVDWFPLNPLWSAPHPSRRAALLSS